MTLNLARASNAPVPFLVGECLAAQGLAVFPARGRQPLTDAGVYSATCDLDILCRMNWRDADGCGLATGAVNGIDVLDVDVRPALCAAALGDREGSPHDDSKNGFAELGRLGLALPETLTAQTPRGGKHFFLRHVVGGRSCDLCNGVEWFGDKKLVVLPPAPRRAWLNRAEIAEAPDSLRALVLSARHSHGGDMGVDSSGPLVKPYDRPSNRDVPRDIWFAIKDGMPNAEPRTRRRVRGLWDKLAGKREDRNKGLNYTAWTFRREFVDTGDLDFESAAALLWYACDVNGYIAKDAAKAREVITRVLLRGDAA
jgi:hypothetical protein